MLTEAQCWTAVLARDREYDGQFVFAVRTTGVYCRPSCRCRRPLRENVRFYSAPSAAEADGYRACKRCAPQVADAEQQTIAQACAALTADPTLTLAQLGAQVGLSPAHLQRVFKRVVGVSPRQYAEAKRRQAFKHELRHAPRITDAVYNAGYASISSAYEDGPAALGMTPTAYRAGGAGQHIGYTLTTCAFARLLLAGTAQGVCAIHLLALDDSVDDNAADQALIAQLAAEYPAATLYRDDVALGAWVQVLLDYTRGALERLHLPLDVRGTAFQAQVWAAVQAIPQGETRTYRQIAEQIGRPSAARAVANAVGSNRVAVLIPCHRVIREDGGMGGYRWGLVVKQALLALEGVG
jgi:AraC family transcriptional regulator, regulatory protein of adaptative response / methylated-DNA-[protein]-cysteine methyltransferase